MYSRKILSLALIILAGCAAPTRKEMLTASEGYNLPAPKEGSLYKALVYIVRPYRTGSAVRFNIFVNDVKQDSLEAGFNRGNQHFWFYLGKGKHKLFSVAENVAELEIDVQPESTYFIKQEPRWGIVYARNSLTKIDSVEGKYSVMKTSKGTTKRLSFP